MGSSSWRWVNGSVSATCCSHSSAYILSSWDREGLVISSGSDLATICQSILASSLLPQTLTRRWLKPISNTADLRFSVGMPWEIARTTVPVQNVVFGNSTSESSTRITDLYTKNGGIGAYYAQIALSPDHGFGFVLLTAGRPPTSGPDQRFRLSKVSTNW